MTMGDQSDALETLLGPDGFDRGLLTANEIAINDLSRLIYTEGDKKALRQFEAMAEPAKLFSKFAQVNENAWSYLLFEAKMAIQSTTAPTTAMYADVSRMDRTVDVRKRGDKTVLVKRSGVTVTPETSANYTKVEVMDPMVQKYCDLYSADLAERLGLNSTILPHYLSVGILLNPLLGKKECVVACGLLTDVQYETARNRKSFEFIVSFLSARWTSHRLCL